MATSIAAIGRSVSYDDHQRCIRPVVGMGRPRESMLMIDGDIHYPVMELSPEDRRNREKVNEAVRRYREGD
jgi:hypothetical protein